MTKTARGVISLLMACALIAPFDVMVPGAVAQDQSKAAFSQEQLEQVVAPIALYPDSLLVQILMASTYPLEVVQADRWVRENKDLKEAALADALEKQSWDPSVKSLVNFPQVLEMMSKQLDWTQKLGDAFLAQQKEVMSAIQKLRAKAEAEGNLKTSKEQKVIVEKETQTIVIEPANPQVIYVPSYNPTVVYGAWPYPAYPPYYYPAPYAPLWGFAAGVALGAAWSNAWGGCDWHGGDVNINSNRNANFNRSTSRGDRASQRPAGGEGKWQHNPEHRKGASYRDQGTAQKFNRGSTNDAIKSREDFRGRAEAGRQDLSRGGADQFKGRQGAGERGGFEGRGGAGQGAGRDFSGQRSNAFSGMDRGGSQTRDFSNRGSSSRQSMSSGSRGGGGFSGGGGGRGGGGGGRGGGRR